MTDPKPTDEWALDVLEILRELKGEELQAARRRIATRLATPLVDEFRGDSDSCQVVARALEELFTATTNDQFRTPAINAGLSKDVLRSIKVVLSDWETEPVETARRLQILTDRMLARLERKEPRAPQRQR